MQEEAAEGSLAERVPEARDAEQVEERIAERALKAKAREKVAGAGEMWKKRFSKPCCGD